MPFDTSDTDITIYEHDDRTGLLICPARDAAVSAFARTMLDGKYLRDGETPQMGHARAARAWCGGDVMLAQRLYEAASRGWFMWASPVLANAPLPGEKVKGMPISCFLNYVGDSLEEIIGHSTETRWLAVLGGGVGGHWRLRAASGKSPGAIPFIKTMDADMEAFRQGKTRRGSYAAYMDISHPDVREFIHLRMQTAGDASRKCFSTGFNHGLNITDAFMRAVETNADWDLVDPHDGTVRETVRARELWEDVLTVRNRAGEPYLFFIDTAQRAMPEAQSNLGLKLHGSNICCEIVLPTNEERTAVCCLSSLNAELYDEWKDTSLVADLVTMLDNVLEYFIQNAPDVLGKAKFSAMRERAIGLGMMGWHALLQKRMIPFESQQARDLNHELFSFVKAWALGQSYLLGGLRGEAPDMAGTGLRNSHRLALAPNANSAILLDTSPSIEPWSANVFAHDTRVGTWLVRNKYLERVLEAHGRNDEATWQNITVSKGSVQHLDFLTEHERAVFKTAMEINQMWVVRHAADRQRFICQAQSVNLFFPAGSDKRHVNEVHLAAWRLGLKSLYYYRSESKNRVENISGKLTRNALADYVPANTAEDSSCESCQG